MFEERHYVKSLVMEAECLIEKVNSENREETRNVVFTEVDKYIKRPLNLNNSDLKKEKEILFIQTDKSNRIAVMDRVDYNNKMLKANEDMNCSLIEKCPLNKINKN